MKLLINEDEKVIKLPLIKRIKAKVKRMKQDVLVLYYAYQHPQTPLSAKLIIGLTIGYLLSPIDLIPDFIPVLGLLDDLIIVPLLIVLSIKLIPDEVWLASRKRAEEEPIALKKSKWWFAVGIVIIWILILWGIYAISTLYFKSPFI